MKAYSLHCGEHLNIVVRQVKDHSSIDHVKSKIGGRSVSLGKFNLDRELSTLLADLLREWGSNQGKLVRSCMSFLHTIINCQDRLLYFLRELIGMRLSPSIITCFSPILWHISILSNSAWISSSSALVATTLPAKAMTKVPAQLLIISPTLVDYENGLKDPSKLS